MTFLPPAIQNGYIDAGIIVDPNAMIQLAFAHIQAKYPGWQPHEGQLDVAIIEEAAQMMAVCATVASQVPVEIFEAFGQLVGVDVILGAAASCSVLFTMTDTAGYTIPAGYPVQFALTGSQDVIFIVQQDVVIPPGETTGTGIIMCETVGTFANEIPAGAMQPVVSFPQIDTVASTTTTSGGADPETSSAYINRLSNELQLLSPRPILISDFADLAANVPGVYRALAIDNLAPGRVVTDGVTTNASLNVTSASADFTSLDVGRTVTDSAGHIPAGATIATVVSATEITLSAGHAATANGTADTLTFGSLSGVERCVTVCGVDIDGNELSSGVNTDLENYLEGLREVNFLVFTIDPTYTEIDVNVNCDCIVGATPSVVQAAIIANLEEFLSQAIWGGGNYQVPSWVNTSNIVRFLDIADVARTTQGVLYIPSSGLTICTHGGTPGTSDITLPGNAPLPNPGTLTVSVTSPS